MKYAGMPMGMCTLMKELGLYDLVPVMCRLDYTMSEAGGVTEMCGNIRWLPAGLTATADIKRGLVQRTEKGHDQKRTDQKRL